MNRPLTARQLIDRLRERQMQEYSHEEFLKVLKNRIRRWNGDQSVMFQGEEEIARRLIEMKVIDEFGHIQD
mgnify:CR=1 FL=1